MNGKTCGGKGFPECDDTLVRNEYDDEDVYDDNTDNDKKDDDDDGDIEVHCSWVHTYPIPLGPLLPESID